MVKATIRTCGPTLWGVFHPDWLGGRVPAFEDTSVLACLAYARQQRIY